MVKHITATIIIVAVLICFSGCKANEKIAKTDFAMGSNVEITVYDLSVDVDGIIKRIKDLDGKISKNISTSEVSQINNNQNTLIYAPTVAKLLDTANKVHFKSGGVFNPACGTLTDLWNIDNLKSVPNDSEIQDAVDKSDYNSISVNDNYVMITNGAKLDLGAIGKGAACGAVIEALGENAGIVTVGGSVGTNSTKPDHSSWKIAVRKPDGTAKNACVIDLNGKNFISTSGSYEKFVTIDGIKYHHIIDTQTGYPRETKIASATVICDDGALSDALSTAAFMLSIDKAKKICEDFNAQYVIIDNQNKMFVSNSLTDCINDISSEYTVIYDI